MQTKRYFSSYGPVDTESHYYVPRKAFVDRAIQQLVGANPIKGGHFFTVWAPRQTGKTWIMWQTLYRLQAEGVYTVVCMSAGIMKDIKKEERMIELFYELIQDELKFKIPAYSDWDSIKTLVSKKHFEKPLIWIIDEFDALPEHIITTLINIFREIYLKRNKYSGDKQYNLQGLALIGVRSVLGIDNKKGSPFNIQKSIHIPNLTFEEVKQMYDDYQREWEQPIDPEVVERLFYETNGQPGLISWFGELMVEKYNKDYPKPIGMKNWKEVYAAGSAIEPNNTILNLISKACDPLYRNTLSELFNTTVKTAFSFDDKDMNYLYMNGIVLFETEITNTDDIKYWAKFSSPFVQKRLFNRFVRELYPGMGQIIKPFEKIDHIFDGKLLNIKNMLRRFEQYLYQNKEWLLRNAPRRKSDLRICEANYHFILYGWLSGFLRSVISVVPEFPTGNGKIDLLVRCQGLLYGIEVKSFSDVYMIPKNIQQVAHYAQQLKLTEIFLAIFIDSIDDENRNAIEIEYIDEATQVKVYPVFIATNE